MLCPVCQLAARQRHACVLSEFLRADDQPDGGKRSVGGGQSVRGHSDHHGDPHGIRAAGRVLPNVPPQTSLLRILRLTALFHRVGYLHTGVPAACRGWGEDIAISHRLAVLYHRLDKRGGCDTAKWGDGALDK